jgi:hypothetical protein
MTDEDEKDYGRFLEGIEFFLNLDVQQTMEHIKQHKKAAVTAGGADCGKRRKQLRILKAFGTVNFDPSYDYKVERRRKQP